MPMTVALSTVASMSTPGAIGLPPAPRRIQARLRRRRGYRVSGVAETATRPLLGWRSFCAQPLLPPACEIDIFSGMLDALFGGNSGNKKQQQEELQALVIRHVKNAPR